MPVTIPIEAYEELEKGLGKEGAKKVVKALESVISDATEYKWKVSKEEIIDAMRKESDNMRGEFNGLRGEFNGLRNVFDGLKVELRKEFVTKGAVCVRAQKGRDETQFFNYPYDYSPDPS